MWIPKGAPLIKGRRLFEAWCLLEEIQYLICKYYFIDDELNLYYIYLRLTGAMKFLGDKIQLQTTVGQ